jgi:hypothetical protein
MAAALRGQAVGRWVDVAVPEGVFSFSILKRIDIPSQSGHSRIEEAYMGKPKRSSVFALGTIVYSSKNASDLLTACCFQLRRGNDNPYWMDYQECCHSLAILYFLCLHIGSYLSTRG